MENIKRDIFGCRSFSKVLKFLGLDTRSLLKKMLWLMIEG